MNAGGISIEEQRAFNEQMKAKGEAIRTNKLASDLYVAEQNFNNFVNSVFNIITATLTGEEPEQAAAAIPAAAPPAAAAATDSNRNKGRKARIENPFFIRVCLQKKEKEDNIHGENHTHDAAIL